MHNELVTSKINSRIFESDLKSIIQRCEKVFCRLSGEKILITGATGFIGTWLTYTFLMANKELGCKIEVDIVYRDELKLKKIYSSNLNKIRNKNNKPISDFLVISFISQAKEATLRKIKTMRQS